MLSVDDFAEALSSYSSKWERKSMVVQFHRTLFIMNHNGNLVEATTLYSKV